MASDAERIQEFVQEFLVPLMTGQDDVVIGLPIDRDVFEGLVADLETGALGLSDVDLAIQRRVGLLLADPVLVQFNVDALKIAVGIHQLLFSFHADAERGKVSDKRLATLAQDTAMLLAQVKMPESFEQLLLHHSLIDPFFLLYRKDVQIFFRLGGKQFFGEEVEWLRLPFRWRIHHEEVLGKDVATNIFQRETGAAFNGLLRLSPLTRLLRADRLLRKFSFEGTLPVMRQPTLVRHVIHTVIDRGLPSFLPAYAHAFGELLEDRKVSPGDKAYVARFLVTLAMTDALWHPDYDTGRLLDARYRPPSDALRFEAPELEKAAAAQGLTDRKLREQLNRTGWAYIHALLERQDVVKLPGSDIEGDVMQHLRDMLKRLEPELEAVSSEARDGVRKAFVA